MKRGKTLLNCHLFVCSFNSLLLSSYISSNYSLQFCHLEIFVYTERQNVTQCSTFCTHSLHFLICTNIEYHIESLWFPNRRICSHIFNRCKRWQYSVWRPTTVLSYIRCLPCWKSFVSLLSVPEPVRIQFWRNEITCSLLRIFCSATGYTFMQKKQE